MIVQSTDYFIVPGQGISFIWIVVRIRLSWATHKFNFYCCENMVFENRKRKNIWVIKLLLFGQIFIQADCIWADFILGIVSVAGCIYCKL